MRQGVDRSYLAIVTVLMLVLPLVSLLIETREPSLALVGMGVLTIPPTMTARAPCNVPDARGYGLQDSIFCPVFFS